MAVYKCKMCGGTLEVQPGATTCECEYCGTVQTIPSVNEENLQSLFNRANTLRMKAEFDKAAEIYEKIIQVDESEAEAYWGLVLCKYGVEYVEDPATYKRIPTCHRTSYEAVIADEDYRSAIEHADMSQKLLYEEEAKAIDEIQKGILAIADQESDYDVFICYKETDENGERTVDSVIANDIYHELSQEGFKVFYSAITLEDKLGTEYEPYIFSALNSAKVMLVIGTKPEYFNAVWVKNEWSRFLKLMQNDRSRTLIPCYRDMDAYELPEEFAHLQAQDMSKIGFINDITRGIRKLIVVPEESLSSHNDASGAGATKEAAYVANMNVLLKRAFMFLEDSDWEKADQYCEQVLDMDPENARAYLGKLMADLKVNRQSALSDSLCLFGNNTNFKKAMQFGDDSFRAELQKANSINIQNIELKFNKKLSEMAKTAKLITAHSKNTIGVATTGKVFARGENDLGGLNVENWNGIVAVSGGKFHTVGLKNDGTVVATGLNSDGQCNVEGWSDIAAVSCSDRHTVGLKIDGTVVAVGKNDYGQCNVEGWNNIATVLCGVFHTVGLEKDGHVVATGSNHWGQCNVEDWSDIILVACQDDRTVGLKSDGTVVVAGKNEERYYSVEGWRDIVAVSCGDFHIVGLKKDGTVVATETNYEGLSNVEGWRDIVAVFCGDNNTVGLKNDGTVVAAGLNDNDQCNVEGWRDIVAVSCGDFHIVGLKKDGTVVATGQNDKGQCDVKYWRLFNNISTLEEEQREYFKINTEKREKLMEEKRSLENQVAALNIEISRIPGTEKIKDLQDAIDDLVAQKEALGKFKGKEKKLIQENIDKANGELVSIKNQVNNTKAKIEKDIRLSKKELDEINMQL